MQPLSETIARLAKLRAQPMHASGSTATRLTELVDFGSNPGALGAYYHVPEGAAASAPLVVVLHGCTQNAAGYDLGSGWSQLADRHGFIVLFPEQRRANNSNLCFNWFEPGDSRRDMGEPLSIVQMIDEVAKRHGVDRSRIYVTGLSAGGAMASTMLATYPDLFSGGAIIAGLPFGSAAGVPQALERMRGRGEPSSASLATAITAASSHRGPWPTVSIWHGTADHVVAQSNADAILQQWLATHGIAPDPDRTDKVDGFPHRVWNDADGRPVIEDYRVTGMGHGTPLAATGEQACGQSGPHMLETGISSTRHIAAFWGLLDNASSQIIDAAPPTPPRAKAVPLKRIEPEPANSNAAGVGKVIEDALRAAGLMR
ncbi:extracellular catalytic domain type 1 short-chain-length polyhydroxyalkanoate depolymerase [Sphingomonas sp. LT1P40]|uniref:extracellular catalytic domain type 1 short-chain-length polyhydroxyalkanoate depolymerase n=1 Tax=Alteristakelama amylovorans TaxID=3096166 RepID=UPI002FC5A897